MERLIDLNGAKWRVSDLAAVLEAQGLTVLPKMTLAIGTFEGYEARYYELCSEEKTFQAAWQKLEDEYFSIFGNYNYASWVSFRTVAAYRKKNGIK